MKRWIVLGGLVAVLVAVLLVTLAFTGTEPETTEDIDAILDPINHRMDTATFVPDVSKDVVIGKSMDSAGKVLIGKDTSDLETRATVGLYTGKDNRGNQVEERKVWLVVVDDLPVTFPSGPAGVDRSHQRQQNQLVVFYDADTGEKIEGSLSGRWVDKENP